MSLSSNCQERNRLTTDTGYSSLHNRYISHLHTPVHARSPNRPCRIQRVHFLRLQQDPGTVCQEDAQQALADCPNHVLDCHDSFMLSLHFRARQASVKHDGLAFTSNITLIFRLFLAFSAARMDAVLGVA